MVILAIAASLVLTVLFILKRRQLKAGGGNRLAYHFCDKSLDFLIPFSIIGSLFLLLSLFVSGTSDSTTIQNLIRFEKWVGLFKWFVSWLKVGALVAIGLLLIFYLISLTRIPSKYTSKLVPFFKKYQKVVKPIYMVAIILFSFTFFGTQAGKPSARLRFRIKEAEGKYGDLRQEVDEAVSREVAKKLMEKAKAALPKDYRDDLEEQNQYFIIIRDLSNAYQAFKNSYNSVDPAAESIINKPPPPDPPPVPRDGGGGSPVDGGGGGSPPPSSSAPKRDKASDKGSEPKTVSSGRGADNSAKPPSSTPQDKQLVYELFEADERPPSSRVESPPPQASAEKIENAKNSVKSYRERFQLEAIQILKSEHGKEISIQLPKVFTGKLKELLFKTLTDRYPILEPVVGAFFGTLDKDLETRTQKAVDKVTSRLAENPENAASVISEEASRVVEQTQIKTPSLLMSKARQAGEALRKRAQSIKDAIAGLQRRSEKLDEIANTLKEADNQIHLLSCRNETSRLEAARKLAAASAQLRQEQVEKIENLLLDDSPRLRISRANPRYFEEVPVRYYAALALQNMRSQYMTEGINGTAAEVINKVDSTPLSQRVYYKAQEVLAAGATVP